MGTVLPAAGAIAGAGAKLAGPPQGESHATRGTPLFSGALRCASQHASQDGAARCASSSSHRAPAQHDTPAQRGANAPPGAPARHAGSAAHGASAAHDQFTAHGAQKSSTTPAAQVASLLRAGTAFQSVLVRATSAVTNAVKNLAPSGGDRTSLARAVRSALSPPSNAPPGMTAAQRTATLARHVTSGVTVVAREAQAAGQQNEISGHVLDAVTTAKDLPAQPNLTAAPNGAADSLAQTLLAQIASELQGDGAAALAAAAQSGAVVAASVPAPQGAGSDAPSSETAAVQQSDASQAPDLLGRMIARAVGGDARLNGRAPAAPAQAAAPRVAFARLIAAVEGSVGDAQGEPLTSARGPNDRAESSTALAASSVTALGAPSAGTPGAPNASTANAASASAAQTYDAEAILAQVVRGIVVRSGGGTQQIRLRLQPESLGEVSLKLTIDGSSVNAAVTAQNADVRDVLLANQPQLSRAFADAGLRLGGFSVDVSGGNAQNDDGRRGEALAQRFAIRSSARAPEIASNAPGAAVPPSGTGLLEYFV